MPCSGAFNSLYFLNVLLVTCMFCGHRIIYKYSLCVPGYFPGKQQRVDVADVELLLRVRKESTL